MARKITPSQARSMMRKAQSDTKRAVSKYNTAVRKLDREVNSYNREVRAHNARVRINQRRYEAELNRLSRQPVSVRYTVTQTSTRTLQSSFSRVVEVAEVEDWQGQSADLLDLAEAEATNSTHVLNTLLDEDGRVAPDPTDLKHTTLGDELPSISPDLDSRWRGALYALDPINPDAARHFCISAREVLTLMIDGSAPDDAVFAAYPDCERRPGSNQPSRRSKTTYLLTRAGVTAEPLQEFVDTDIDDVLALFQVFNAGTHGSAGTFDLSELAAIKVRVEGAIRFMHAVIRG